MRRGLAIVNMLIYVVIFSILSGVVLGVLSTSTRELEKNIRRTKGFYTDQAGMVFALDQLRQSNTFPIGPLGVPWVHDIAGNAIASKQVGLSNESGAGISGTMVVNSTTDYTINW